MVITTVDALLSALNRGQRVRCRFLGESDETNLRFLEVQRLDVRFRMEDGLSANTFDLNKNSLSRALEIYRDFEVELPTDIPFGLLPV